MSVFLLNGDLGQMAKQGRFLENKGFLLGKTDVFPTLNKEDVKPALTNIFRSRVDGWWNYRDNLITLDICTVAEFKEALISE